MDDCCGCDAVCVGKTKWMIVDVMVLICVARTKWMIVDVTVLMCLLLGPSG